MKKTVKEYKPRYRILWVRCYFDRSEILGYFVASVLKDGTAPIYGQKYYSLYNLK